MLQIEKSDMEMARRPSKSVRFIAHCFRLNYSHIFWKLIGTLDETVKELAKRGEMGAGGND